MLSFNNLTYESDGVNPKQITDMDVATRYLMVKNSAARRNKPFTLTLRDVRALLKTRKCFYTGKVLGVSERSLDCVDPTKGYVTGNVVLCDKNFNHRKSNLTVDEVRLMWQGMCKATIKGDK